MKNISYLCISDIHLGHKRTATKIIIDNLNSFFEKYSKKIKNVDIIFIAGDIFDTLLATNSIAYYQATRWLTFLIMYCKQHNIKLRVLEGTPSHDWKQANLITGVIEQLKIDVDYKYIQTLYVEKMIDLDLNILYIPDEYKPTADEVYSDVLTCLKENNLTNVDIAILHGMFKYQIPQLDLPTAYNENNFLSIVNHYINIGHIHTPSVFDRIIANGSFDRLAHNEEEDKGGVICYIKDGNRSFEFLKNDNAMIYKTYDYTDFYGSTEALVKELTKSVSKLPDGSYVRIKIRNEDHLQIRFQELKNSFINLNIKIQTEEVTHLKLGDDIKKEEVIETFAITPDNIRCLILQELEGEQLNPKELKIVNEELDNYI